MPADQLATLTAGAIREVGGTKNSPGSLLTGDLAGQSPVGRSAQKLLARRAITWIMIDANFNWRVFVSPSMQLHFGDNRYGN